MTSEQDNPFVPTLAYSEKNRNNLYFRYGWLKMEIFSTRKISKKVRAQLVEALEEMRALM